jgi:hypothetical protein
MQNSNRFPNIIIGTDDVFEINDFTVVTEFEIFVLSLENALQELREETEAGGKVIAFSINFLHCFSGVIATRTEVSHRQIH